jgi:hypothetical protein
MTLQPIPSEFPYICGKLDFLSYQCIFSYVMKHMSGYNVSLPWASCGNLWNNNLTCVDVGSTKAGQAG